MGLSNENLGAYLQGSKITLTARDSLETLRGRASQIQSVIKATAAISLEGSISERQPLEAVLSLLSAQTSGQVSNLSTYRLNRLLKAPTEALPFELAVAKTSPWPNRLTNCTFEL